MKDRFERDPWDQQYEWVYTEGGLQKKCGTASVSIYQLGRDSKGNTWQHRPVVRRFRYTKSTKAKAEQKARDLCEELNKIEHVSKCSDAQVRFNYSKIATLEAGKLWMFHLDSDPRVRKKIARHPNVDPDILVKLAEDSDEAVREAVAMSPPLLVAITQNLLDDTIGSVSSAARRSMRFRAKSHHA